MEERRKEYDPARLLTWAALLFVFVIVVFVFVIIGLQITAKGEANTESWAALTGLIGWVTGTVSVIYNARYGISKSGEKAQESVNNIAQGAAPAQVAAVAAARAPAGTEALAQPLGPVVTPAPATADGVIPAAAVAKKEAT